MKKSRRYRKGELYEGEDREKLRTIIHSLSYMGLTDKEKSNYCRLAYSHIGLNKIMIAFNCLNCGIKKCKVRASVHKAGF